MSLVQKVVRKQLVLEAIQFVDDPEVVAALAEWMGREDLAVTYDRGAPQLIIDTPNGWARVDAEWWIVQVEPGKFRGLEPEVYQANFEVAAPLATEAAEVASPTPADVPSSAPAGGKKAGKDSGSASGGSAPLQGSEGA